MSGDDVYIEKFRKIITGQLKKDGLAIRRHKSPSFVDGTDFFKTGGQRVFIDAGSTIVELGHPLTASFCLGMVTEKDELVEDGRVTVIGDELSELSNGRHSFALVMLAKVMAVDESSRRAISGKMSACEHFAGCMTRISSERIWIRFSQEALDRGVTLQAIGRHLITELKNDHERFNKAEAVLIVAASEYVEALRPIVNGLAEDKSIRYKTELGKVMACETGLSCDECPETDTCQVLKDAVALAKKAKNDTARN